MKKISTNKILKKAILVITACAMFLICNGIQASAMPTNPTMNYNWGFTYKPLQIPTGY